MLAYGSFKMSMMVSYEQASIQMPDFKGHFESDYSLEPELGWNVAFGLTAYDSSSSPEPLSSKYGKLTAF